MMRIAVGLIGVLSLGLAGTGGAVAQIRNAPSDHWQAADKSMTDLLLEGYRLVSVIAPNPQLRIYFLASGNLLAKCSEEAALARLPPPPPPSPQQPPATQLPPFAPGAPSSDIREAMPEIEAGITCSRLVAGR
jgi:hypothetical protein